VRSAERPCRKIAYFSAPTEADTLPIRNLLAVAGFTTHRIFGLSPSLLEASLWRV